MPEQFHFKAIGTIATPFKEKFGVPRQSLMMTEAYGVLKLEPDANFPQALRHLEQFSHVWLLFVFDRIGKGSWHPLIETPRVEAGSKMGVFATRSPHRPNPIGMSAVKLEKIDLDAPGGIEIHLSGVDLLDGTSILDIKPYLPYADKILEANSGWITTDIDKFPVEFSPECLLTLKFLESESHPRIRAIIEQMLELDPRPTSQRRASPISDEASNGLKFAFRVLGHDIQWQVNSGKIQVLKIIPLA